MNPASTSTETATSPSALLQGEHEAIDAAVLAASTGTLDAPALARAMQQLLRHFYLEEAVMFPPLLETGLTMPVTVMQQEHGEMWGFMQKLMAACASGTLDAATKRQAHKLRLHLRVHNPKEEEVVYAAADRYVAEHPDSTMVADLKTAAVPPGWRCAALTQAPG